VPPGQEVDFCWDMTVPAGAPIAGYTIGIYDGAGKVVAVPSVVVIPLERSPQAITFSSGNWRLGSPEPGGSRSTPVVACP